MPGKAACLRRPTEPSASAPFMLNPFAGRVSRTDATPRWKEKLLSSNWNFRQASVFFFYFSSNCKVSENFDVRNKIMNSERRKRDHFLFSIYFHGNMVESCRCDHGPRN